MMRPVSDAVADKFILTVLFIIAVSCVSGALAMMMMLPLMIVMVSKCDIKLLPAIMLGMISPGNIKFFAARYTVLRIGITVTPGTMLLIVVFFIVIFAMLRGKFKGNGAWFFPLWMLSAIPAVIISYNGKLDNVSSWSDPVLEFMLPSLFYWGIIMARTYEDGKVYFFKRIMLLMTCVSALFLLQFMKIDSYLRYPLITTMALYLVFAHNRDARVPWNFVIFAVAVAVLDVTIGRYLHMVNVGKEALNAEKHISGFSSLGTLLTAVGISYLVRKRISANMSLLPILLLVLNLSLVTFVVDTQSGNKSVDVEQNFESVEDRFKFKLFGDRGTVWKQGWEQLKDPPYVFVDLKKFQSFNPLTGKIVNIVSPHNQVLTTLTRCGLWLGGFLLLFTTWVQLKAFSSLHRYGEDQMLRMVFLPTGCAIFFIIGICGQSVISFDLWLNALGCYVMPGIAVGACKLARSRPGPRFFGGR